MTTTEQTEDPSIVSDTVPSSAEPGGPATLKSLLYPLFEEIEVLEKMRRPGGVARSNIKDLDLLCGNLFPGEVTIIAGRTSSGKTALAYQYALTAALHDGHTCCLITLESTKFAATTRLLVCQARVDGSRLRNARLSDDDFVHLAEAAGSIVNAPILIDDSCFNLETILESIETGALVHNCKIAIVDYLQLIESPSEAENRYQALSDVSRSLKVQAKRLGIHIIAISQCTRAPDQRADRRPLLSDLRDSGSLEDDADTVMIVHRPECYLSREEASELGWANACEIIVGKNRHGRTGSVTVGFEPRSGAFFALS